MTSWPPVVHALIQRIEAQCNNRLLCAGDLAENILELIAEACAGAPPQEPTAVRFEDGLLQWPGGGMNLSLLRLLLARAGLEIVPAGRLAGVAAVRDRLSSAAGDVPASLIVAKLTEALSRNPLPPAPCGDCSDLRGRLRNIYHLTLNYRDVSAAIVAVREASSPGAPAPSADFQITPEALGLVPPGRSNA